MNIPLARPSPPRLSRAIAALQEIEERGIYSNFGPVNTAFEKSVIAKIFNGEGYCTTTCNATLALMLAIRAVIKTPPLGRRRYALMPSFTFAAAAHAAIWCGLTPLFCDIDPHNWAAAPDAEAKLLRDYGSRIAVIVPYASFGYDIDLAYYEALSRQHGIPVIVDAAASLGTQSANGLGFGTGSNVPIVFSMHATKSFATSEGGLVYSADQSFIQTIRTMSNFGFGEARCATMPGLNAKLSELAALSAKLRLNDFEEIINHRSSIVQTYRASLPELMFQTAKPHRQAHQFVAALLPASLARFRAEIQESLAAKQIGIGKYFSPHLAQQSYFKKTGKAGILPVSDAIGARMISLPLYDSMTPEIVSRVAAELRLSLVLRHPPAPLVPAFIATAAINLAAPPGARAAMPILPPVYLAARTASRTGKPTAGTRTK
jgi:dTDP-4-amino-4,6-dideoxygalactose transaminase